MVSSSSPGRCINVIPLFGCNRTLTGFQLSTPSSHKEDSFKNEQEFEKNSWHFCWKFGEHWNVSVQKCTIQTEIAYKWNTVVPSTNNMEKVFQVATQWWFILDSSTALQEWAHKRNSLKTQLLFSALLSKSVPQDLKRISLGFARSSRFQQT